MNVTKVESVTSSHPKFIKSKLISQKYSAVGVVSEENVIYYFENGGIALLMYDGVSVYGTVLNENEVTNMIVDFDHLQEAGTVDVQYLSGQYATMGWGSCMKSAVDILYNDWGNDPVGTGVCWLTGSLCVVGGGIACALQ